MAVCMMYLLILAGCATAQETRRSSPNLQGKTIAVENQTPYSLTIYRDGSIWMIGKDGASSQGYAIVPPHRTSDFIWPATRSGSDIITIKATEVHTYGCVVSDIARGSCTNAISSTQTVQTITVTRQDLR